MNRFGSYVRQHHVGLIAIMLMLSGGTAYAVTAPKDSVVSSSIKKGAVKTTDVKDGTIRGIDIADGTITADEIAGNAVDDANLIAMSLPAGGPSATVFDDPNIGKVTIGCTADFRGVNSFGSLVISPGSVGVQGLELYGENAADTSRLIGGATVTRDSPAQPVGGVGFGGSGTSWTHLNFHYVTPSKRVFISVDILLCSMRGSIVTEYVGNDTTPPPRLAPNAKRGCVSDGAGYCGSKMRAA